MEVGKKISKNTEVFWGTAVEVTETNTCDAPRHA